jgi:hypothetical protein
MGDKLITYTPNQDILVDTGKGHVAGLVITSTSTTAGACDLFDYVGAGPPTGPKIFTGMGSIYSPLAILFNDRYSPRFNAGLWLHLSANMYLTMWYHMPKEA